MLEKGLNKSDFGRNKNNCHAEKFLLSISTLERNRDPEQQRLRMTVLLNIGQVVPDNKITCHSKLDLESRRVWLRNNEILNQVQDDDYFKEEALNKGSSRAPLRSGFTLIEVLVVVLIIGILAAVALPQYKLAVDKSRIGSLLSLATSIRNAEELHYLSEGSYIDQLSSLDIDFKGCRLVSRDEEIYCTNGTLDNMPTGDKLPQINIWYPGGYSERDIIISLYFAHSSKPNKITCTPKTNYGKKLCTTLPF